MPVRTFLRALLLGVAVLFAVFALLGWRVLSTSPLRAALPWSAADIQDQLIDRRPDFDYLLRARLGEADFRAYTARLGLTPHTADRKYDGDVALLAWGVSRDAPTWWTPRPALDGTFVAQDHQYWTFAKYEDGWLYLRSLSQTPRGTSGAIVPDAPAPATAPSTASP